MTAKMESGWYIVDDPKQGNLNGTKIYISLITKPDTESYIPGKKIVQGGITFSEEYKKEFSYAINKNTVTDGDLGTNAYVFDSKDKKSTLLVSGVKGLFGVIIKPCPTKEGGRRRKTLRNKRKLRLRKTKSANKRR